MQSLLKYHVLVLKYHVLVLKYHVLVPQRQVCAMLLGALHVPERLCGGYLGRYNKCSPLPFFTDTVECSSCHLSKYRLRHCYCYPEKDVSRNQTDVVKLSSIVNQASTGIQCHLLG